MLNLAPKLKRVGALITDCTDLLPSITECIAGSANKLKITAAGALIIIEADFYYLGAKLHIACRLLSGERLSRMESCWDVHTPKQIPSQR
jgi:hypothetical protein